MPDLRSQIATMRKNLTAAIEGSFEDLGKLGRDRASDLLSDLDDELDELVDLLEEEDDGV